MFPSASDIVWYIGFTHILFDGLLATVTLYYCAWKFIQPRLFPDFKRRGGAPAQSSRALEAEHAS